MKEYEINALFLEAGFEIKSAQQIENQYWPKDYVALRAENPWWLVTTEYGVIKIGWRKRVISINWEATAIRVEVTSDDVTKDNDMVHAYSMGKALEYLTELREMAVAQGVAYVEPIPIPTKLVICAHSRDCNNVTAYDVEGSSIELTSFTHGYVPLGMCIGGGDDIELEIDVATGTILNWDAEKVRARITEMTKVEEE